MPALARVAPQGESAMQSTSLVCPVAPRRTCRPEAAINRSVAKVAERARSGTLPRGSEGVRVEGQG